MNTYFQHLTLISPQAWDINLHWDVNRHWYVNQHWDINQHWWTLIWSTGMWSPIANTESQRQVWHQGGNTGHQHWVRTLVSTEVWTLRVNTKYQHRLQHRASTLSVNTECQLYRHWWMDTEARTLRDTEAWTLEAIPLYQIWQTTRYVIEKYCINFIKLLNLENSKNHTGLRWITKDISPDQTKIRKWYSTW